MELKDRDQKVNSILQEKGWTYDGTPDLSKVSSMPPIEVPFKNKKHDEKTQRAMQRRFNR